MKIDPAQQGSLNWLLARCAVVTASELDAIVTPTFKPRTGDGLKTYLSKKVAERWTGKPLPGFDFSSYDMEIGTILEGEAIPYFEFETGLKVQRVGLCTNDEGTIGCSPDGLIGEDSGIEIKCPAIHTHVRYLLEGVLPPDYAAQVHGSMFVTGRSQWRFLSYCRGVPPLLLTIQRDEDIQTKIKDALDGFMQIYDDAYEMLCRQNGGPPKRPVVPVPEPQTPEPDDDFTP
jgi:hypothetical protein